VPTASCAPPGRNATDFTGALSSTPGHTTVFTEPGVVQPYTLAVTTGANGLFHGEKVLWVGAPARVTGLDRRGKVWLGIGVYHVLFLTSLAVVEVPAGNPQALSLIATAMVCFLTIVVAALIQLRSDRRWSRYLITSGRIVHTTKWFGQNTVQSVALRKLGTPTVSAPEGSTIGTIRFDNRMTWVEAKDVIFRFGEPGSLVLRDIDNVHHVRDIILAAQN
jgi:hypothetical protein